VSDVSTGVGGAFSLLWLIIAIPAASAAVLLLVGRRGDRWGHLLGTAAPLASFAIAVAAFAGLLDRPEESRAVGQHLFTWISVNSFHVDFSLLFDQLSAVFVLLITGVGSLIHIYSIGYMAHDERRKRFFAYMNLFVAAMLVLVLADDYLAVFLGWEGVGLASYLLIGFWQHKHTAATAAKKAFVVNRVGDVGMALAIMAMFAAFGTMSFEGVASSVESASTTVLTVIGLLLLLGACGKSAQVPLQSLAAGRDGRPHPGVGAHPRRDHGDRRVYLVTRSHFIYDAAPVAQTRRGRRRAGHAAWGRGDRGAKDDIKRALAGSTMSQIGYMMLAAGLGGGGVTRSRSSLADARGSSRPTCSWTRLG
jgi:NADH-quinone oxidoreductase subunit L